MNRRKFLAGLGLSAVVTKFGFVADAFKLPEPETDVEYYRRKRQEAGPGGWVSYRVHYTVTMPPNAKFRLRYIDTCPNIG